MMYAKAQPKRTTIKTNKSYVGERIEEKVSRIVNNKEPIKDGAPLVYTDRKDGVLASTDIRTDRWEIAIDAMDKVAEQKIQNRTKRFEKKLEEANGTDNKEIGGERTDPKVDQNKAGGQGEGKA